MIRLAIITGLLCLSSPAEEETQGVDLALVSSVRSIAPGSTFTFGVTIHHHPGFHTYWKNPGAVGYPIKCKWTLPPGFTVGPIRWPVPEMSDMAGHPVFGYESDVTLLFDISAPAKFESTPLTFYADLAWMACSSECHPGKKRYSKTLMVADKSDVDPTTLDLFSAAEKRIPQALSDWTSKLDGKPDSETITLTLQPPAGLQDPGSIRIFSSDGQISSEPDPSITRLEGGRYRISAPRSAFSPAQPTSLPLVIVAENPLSPDGRHFGTLDPSYSKPSPAENDQTP
ncbi:protein-disulfide reductase DsbD domain-containing protein [Haloferula sp.]|uniref:protein-disulfide reductase DsbD domain-containing protein n=1 Tax=Haloferula sp. TaxID=2497595 RepID=UPI0032A0B3C0